MDNEKLKKLEHDQYVAEKKLTAEMETPRSSALAGLLTVYMDLWKEERRDTLEDKVKRLMRDEVKAKSF